MQQSNVIEVVHGRDCDGHYYWTVKTDETHDCSISYPAGYERPNYPVPAIVDERLCIAASLKYFLAYDNFIQIGQAYLID